MIPKTLGACADKLYKLRQERLAMERRVAELKEEEAVLRDHIIDTLPKSDASGITGKTCRVTITKSVKPRVEDWDVVYKYISRTKSWDLMQKRLSDTAVNERWGVGKEIPGVGKFTAVTLSITKKA